MKYFLIFSFSIPRKCKTDRVKIWKSENFKECFIWLSRAWNNSRLVINYNMIISPQNSYRFIPGSRLWDHTMSTMERILTLNKWSYIFKLHLFHGFSATRIKLRWALILSWIHFSVNTNNLKIQNQITLSLLISITSNDLK